MSDNDEIRAFVSQVLNRHDVADDTDILATGLASEQFPLQVCPFLERRFGITIEQEDMNVDSFRTVNAMARWWHAGADSAI